MVDARDLNLITPFERLKSRPRPPRSLSESALEKFADDDDWPLPEPTDSNFPKTRRELFNRILVEEDLRFDREGRRRTAYCLRHTYISMRLMEGADIYQIAKNCRTSVEMIEKYYAAHLKTSLDAEAINRRKSRRKKKATADKPSVPDHSTH